MERESCDAPVAQPRAEVHVGIRVDERRHDLDALRAFAMLLGIGLHVSLSFIPLPWPVQDSRQNLYFGAVVAAVHGFRMPLFFLISGFFTMMLYRKRGMGSLLRQRAVRIVIPCLVGLVTVVPLMHAVSGWAMRSAERQVVPAEESLAVAVQKGDRPAVRRFLDRQTDLNRPDKSFTITPLGWAALQGDIETLMLLIEYGADVNRGNADGSTPLHCAAFLGRVEVVKTLLAHGADLDIRNKAGQHVLQSTQADWGVTTYIVGLIGLPMPDRTQLEQDRRAVRELLEQRMDPAAVALASRPQEPASPPAPGVLARYQTVLGSDLFRVSIGGASYHLIYSNVFDHLWFLWFLCWMVSLFGLTVALRSWPVVRWVKSLPVLSTKRFLWVVPLTLVPQWFMGIAAPTFGPDTATGILPPPHLLFYYAIFFGFGALYFDTHDAHERLGRRWWLLLPSGLFIAFPIGLAAMAYRPLAAPAQVFYVWTISIGLMGLFRVLLRKENRGIRYLSDASYWLYLAHLPLVIGMQAIVRPWPWAAVFKFALISTVATAVLLVSYRAFVRYTWIGLILNGRRPRPGRIHPGHD